MMFEHLQQSLYPNRTVVLGAGGFVGKSLCHRLKNDNANFLGLTRKELDLLNSNAPELLRKYLRSDDTLVVISAEAPCKNTGMLYRNIQMMNVICEVLQNQIVKHIIYVSSDAVYTDSDVPLTEAAMTAPTSLHGVMHLAREMMLQAVCGHAMPLAILRCSLLY